MSPSIATLGIAVCGLRPEGSVAQLAAFAFAIWLAWRLSPHKRAPGRPAIR